MILMYWTPQGMPLVYLHHVSCGTWTEGRQIDVHAARRMALSLLACTTATSHVAILVADVGRAQTVG